MENHINKHPQTGVRSRVKKEAGDPPFFFAASQRELEAIARAVGMPNPERWAGNVWDLRAGIEKPDLVESFRAPAGYFSVEFDTASDANEFTAAADAPTFDAGKPRKQELPGMNWRKAQMEPVAEMAVPDLENTLISIDGVFRLNGRIVEGVAEAYKAFHDRLVLTLKADEAGKAARMLEQQAASLRASEMLIRERLSEKAAEMHDALAMVCFAKKDH
jgi:hypothetical protein